MHPVLVIALAVAAALPLGLWLRHDLNQLGYRTADEQDLPNPGPRWWVVWASVIAAAGVSASAVYSHDVLAHLPLAPLVASGPWLSAVDFDVRRIPNLVLACAAALTLASVFGVAAIGQNWRAPIVPLLAALVTGGLYAGVYSVTKGSIGFGDVKLATVIALAVGSLGAHAAWLSILIGSAAALGWAATRAQRPIPYGPWLLCGGYIAVLANIAVP